jgi:two-component system, NtrC family, response regulator AtoC
MSEGRILVCDDEELVRWSLKEHLQSVGYDVVEAADGDAFLLEVERTAPTLAILDLMMPGIDGMSALRRLRERGSDLPVIMLTAVGSAAPIVEATRLGASNYITKPFELDAVTAAVRSAIAAHHAQTHVTGLEDAALPSYAGIVGGSKPMQQVFATLKSLETVDTMSVLISGESGTGKDLVARAIHERGPRRTAPFVEVDCTAIPENLMESTLFGHERGAFTDAKATRRGLFEEAAGGIVFLDEIGELPLGLQSKLLRALENRTFKRVGGNANIRLDAAIVAATNRRLLAEVDAGRFRQDLYYRLAIVELNVPPLRQRRDDVRLLTQHFVRIRAAELGRRIDGLTDEAMDLLCNYAWPGNVRELRNTIERLLIFHEGPIIDADALPPSIRYATSSVDDDCPFLLPEDGVNLDAVERGLVLQAVDRTGGNQTAAAKLLGLSRYALRTRMKKYGLLDGGAA